LKKNRGERGIAVSNSKRALELFLVFLPAVLVIVFAESWVGDNPIAR